MKPSIISIICIVNCGKKGPFCAVTKHLVSVVTIICKLLGLPRMGAGT